MFTNDLSIHEQEFLTSLSNCKNLTSLLIGDNPIIGPLPKLLGSSNISASLETFVARGCNISGTIPSEIGNLSSLFLLNLGDNNLNGMIPETLGHLRDVQHLSIYGNKLHGPIPNSFCNLKNLFYISLKENRLSGQLPICLGNLPSLSEIYLYDNFFNSSIPSTLWSSNRLQIVSISHNMFEGSLSDAIGNMNSLRGLNLSGNQLSGSIPSSIGELQSLTSLWLDNNKFNGSIPSSLGNMKALQYVDLSENNLSGSIPMSLETLTDLDYFNVSFNKLTGQIPDGGHFGNFTSELFIGNKGLCGASRFNVEALVLEYMPNENLEKWFYSPNYSLNIGQRLGIMIDVASAIEYLHQGYSSQIVHCDLKPSNILLDDDMVARVGDFGIAKLLTHDQRMAQTKTLGTIGYMAPEYGSGGLVSTFVDVYSYGILLMETFIKKRPTDEIFLGELTMKRWVSESFPNSIIQIVDNELLNADKEYFVKSNIEECLASIMELAIECTADLPDERPNMKDVHVRLKNVNIKVVN
ncbi:hypothetical protein RD792_006356 [Penstemon davidsonii]|uniref:Protein kinase domain-containing protein n=1 Tax=Penstemon davidsonii TaxID=160366 RepID=A0ABR0DDN1_9LAMI|nr:hypothetical protein RD792_006356 [Penstemon davidsonii]